MNKRTYMRWAAMVCGSAVLLQFGGCFGGDFLLRLAGAGGVVSGLFTLITT